MQTGFFRSRQFVIALIVALCIVGAAAAVYRVADASGLIHSESGCRAPDLVGTPVPSTPSIEREDDGRRTERHTVDASAYEGGVIDLCITVGEILVEATNGSRVEVSFVIDGHPTAVESTQVRAEFRAAGRGLAIGAWEPVSARTQTIWGTDSADVRLVVTVPATGAYAVRLHNDVGDVRLSALRVGDLDARTDVGDVVIRETDLEGDARLHADVGNVILHASSVQTGNISLRSDVGDVEALLPSRVDIGYDAHAHTDVGDVVLRIGDTEMHESEGGGAGEEERARSVGFKDKPTRVTVKAATDVGDARITTS